LTAYFILKMVHQLGIISHANVWTFELKITAIPSPIVAKALCAKAHYGLVGPVAPSIDLVRAKNPKYYTGPGTNTYIVGEGPLWIIDPGPDSAAHIEAVLAAVGDRRVAGILVTHSHMDHSPAAVPIARKTGAKIYGFGRLSADIIALTDEDVDVNFNPDVPLADGHLIGEGDWQIVAMHTPGHFPNHLAFYLPYKGILFSGDHVMGWSTTVVVPPLGNMAEYMESLDKLEQVGAHLMLPSHGPKVENPDGRICEVRLHRTIRQHQVEDCVRRGILDPAAIVREIYVDLADGLVHAAQGCVAAHLEFMTHEDAFILMPDLVQAQTNA
jgi:glyoxylase-like metal-dependent hydrolase (beta-lactamase superfamily II)